MQDGKIVFAEGFGYKDLLNKRPVTTKTQFRAASVSKMMTVTALAKWVHTFHISRILPQPHIQDHHNDKPTDKAHSGDIGVFVPLGLWYHFFDHYKDHGPSGKGQCVG